MERTQIFDLMGELKLYGMKAAFQLNVSSVHNTHEGCGFFGWRA